MCINDLKLMLCFQLVPLFKIRLRPRCFFVNLGKCLRRTILQTIFKRLLRIYNYCQILLKFLLLIERENKKISLIINVNCSLKMSVSFKYFNKSKENDHTTTAMTCSNTNFRFFLKSVDFINISNYNSNPYLQNYFMSQN